jgi:hypothetical protein
LTSTAQVWLIGPIVLQLAWPFPLLRPRHFLLAKVDHFGYKRKTSFQIIKLLRVGMPSSLARFFYFDAFGKSRALGEK